jgi:acetylornithine/N-succinyldiaminopimelate aminotransferase
MTKAEKTMIQEIEKLFLNTYQRYPFLVKKAEGAFIYSKNRKYLDMITGIGVMSLGHSDKDVKKEILKQLKLHLHLSNLFWQKSQIEFAKEFLSTLKGKYKIFLSNSGAEAVETAIKIAKLPFDEKRRKFLAFYGSFHGRTHGALSLTWKEDFRKPFEPLIPGVKFIPYGDIETAYNELKKLEFAGVIVEPIQGEAGVITPPEGFLKNLKSACEETGTLLILDEIQTGAGKTGKFWCFEWENIEPDILVSSKAIGGGLPLGVTAVSDKIAELIKPGMHASTFGGNPLSCSAGKITIRKIKKMLKNVLKKGEILKKEIEGIGFEVSGKGLMLGIIVGKISKEPREINEFFLNEGIIINTIRTPTEEIRIRILPPFIISEREISMFVDVLKKFKKLI